MEEFQLSRFVKEGSDLLRDVTEEFNRLGIDTSKLPKIFPDDSGKIKLVFIGQYSAGKSSIIKMLTGEDVEIGAKITTQNSQPYPWNGLEIIDTPGIHTELRPDHDEITYDQINHAALLVFVITNEGFSQRMGDHFRNLAIDQKRGGNMVLVVNKMDRTALGNVPEQQKIIRDDLQKVIEPFTPEQLYLSFIDTTSFFDSLEESDPQFKQDLFNDSGHDQFVENLNRFVADKGILQKINLPLNMMSGAIHLAIGGVSSEEKEDISEFIKTMRKRRTIILDAQSECRDEINGLISEYKTTMERVNRETVEKAIPSESEDEFNKKIKSAQDEFKKFAEECARKISDCVKNFATKLELDLKTYESSTFVQQVNQNLLRHIKFSKSGGIGGAAALGIGGAAAFSGGAQLAASLATPASQVVTSGLGMLAGDVAEIATVGLLAEDMGILSGAISGEVGNFVRGLSIFEETVVGEATALNKFASIFTGNVTKILGGAAIALSIFMLHHSSQKAKENDQKIRQARLDLMSEFRKSTEDVARKIDEHVRSWMTENIDPIVLQLDERIKSAEEKISASKIKNEKLDQMLSRVENLIGEIQRAQ